MQKTQTICLVVLTTIAIGFSLAFLKTVLLPFIIAIFIVIGCRPILEFVQRRLKLHRTLAFAVTFLTGMILFFGFAFLVWISINDLSRNADAYEKRLDYIAAWVIERVPDSQKTVGLGASPANANFDSRQSDSAETGIDVPDQNLPTDGDLSVERQVELSVAEEPSKAVDEFFSYLSAFAQRQLLTIAGSLSTLLSYGVLILIFVFFLLLGNSSQLNQPMAQPDSSQGILKAVEVQVRKYLVLKTIISLLTGFAFGGVLWLFGVPLAIVFGFLAFLLNYIPNIGPLISTLLPLPFLILNSSMNPTAAVVCFLLIAAIQFVSGNVIETKIMGQSFDVSPVFLLLALMFFGLIWGLVGMFLATPLVSIVKIVLEQSQMGKPVAELMAGTWNDWNRELV